MKQIFAHEDVDIPKDVKVKVAGRTVTVTGPRGTLTKNFNHMKIEIKKVNKGKTVRAEMWFGSRANLAAVRTIITHIRNMFVGVTKGFLYKMKLVNNHFPISITQEGKSLEIRNFIGEKIVRTVPVPEGVTFARASDAKDEIVFTGNDVDVVSQVCADIHTCTLVKNKDIRKFLDGIYVSYRGNVVEDI